MPNIERVVARSEATKQSPGIASARVGEPRNDGGFPFEAIRQQFPILSRPMRGHPLAYLDNASTTQKPQRVIDAEKFFYETMNANVHRGVYALSEEATVAYVGAHEAVAQFINAKSGEEIVFVRNATEGINLIAQGVGSREWGVGTGDVILFTAMEHHSNIVPWQQVARRTGATIEWVELTPDGQLDLDDLDRKLTSQGHSFTPLRTGSEPKRRISLVAITHVSNVLGTVNPVQDIVRIAHEAGALVLVDAAQSVSRFPVNVQELGVDFLVFSGHKMYGPTGIGVVYGKRHLLEAMGPFLTGGDMVKTVTRTSATWNDLPWKFEAGTPNIAGGVALGETVRFLREIGMEQVWAHEQELVRYALPKLLAIPGLRLLGPVPGSREQGIGSREPTADNGRSPLPPTPYPLPPRAGVFSFTLPGIHSHDLASFLDERGIAIRGGHHCAQPLLATLGLAECARASVGVYTTKEEIDQLVGALEEARRVLG